MELEHEGDVGVLTVRRDANGAPVTIEVHGEGPPVVMIGAGVPRQWTGPLTRSLRTDHAVVNFDYEPHDAWDGRTEARTCVQMAADTLAVMDRIGLERAHVVGVSRGAVAAFALAARHEERVLSAALLVPVAPFGELLLDPTAPGATERPEDPADWPRYYADLTFSAAWMARHGDEMEAMLGQGPYSVVRVSRDDEDAMHPSERPARPTLIALATDDRVVGRENAEALRAAVPDARWVELPGEHGALLEDPDRWAEELRRFIADVAGAS